MKKFAGFFAGILICTAAFAVDVNKDELQSAQSDAVQFENYGGPHAVIETADAITGIGRYMDESPPPWKPTSRGTGPFLKRSLL